MAKNKQKENLSFLPVYELGRLYARKEKEGRAKFEDISKIEGSSPRLVKEVENLVQTVCANALAEKELLLLDLTLYDPNDPKGKSFYMVIYSTSKSIIEAYRELTESNIENEIAILSINEIYTKPIPS